MKKIIDGKKYDTTTATKIYEWSDGYANDFAYIEETLYRKRNGEYFIHGYGGAMSRYATPAGQNSWSDGSMIIPVSYDSARDWMEQHADVEDYEREFGEVSEGGDDVAITIRVSESTRQMLRRMASESGKTQGEIIGELIADAYSC